MTEISRTAPQNAVVLYKINLWERVSVRCSDFWTDDMNNKQNRCQYSISLSDKPNHHPPALYYLFLSSLSHLFLSVSVVVSRPTFIRIGAAIAAAAWIWTVRTAYICTCGCLLIAQLTLHLALDGLVFASFVTWKGLGFAQNYTKVIFLYLYLIQHTSEYIVAPSRITVYAKDPRCGHIAY